jgi:hypothetical protein
VLVVSSARATIPAARRQNGRRLPLAPSPTSSTGASFFRRGKHSFGGRTASLPGLVSDDELERLNPDVGRPGGLVAQHVGQLALRFQKRRERSERPRFAVNERVEVGRRASY